MHKSSKLSQHECSADLYSKRTDPELDEVECVGGSAFQQLAHVVGKLVVDLIQLDRLERLLVVGIELVVVRLVDMHEQVLVAVVLREKVDKCFTLRCNTLSSYDNML